LAELTRWFTPAIARSPQLLQLGRNCIALGQWSAAAAIFRRILEADPAHAEAAAALATAESGAAQAPAVARNDPCPCGSGKRYKHCHGAGAGASPAVAEPGVASKLKQALSLHARGEADAALPLYREVLAADPDNPTAQHYLGVIHYQRGNLAEGLPLLERAVAARPDEPEFHNNLGLALAAADRQSEAIAQYRAALSLQPDHAVAWNNLGLTLQARNEVRAGIDAFRHALALKPDFTRARWNLALALLLDGQFVEGWREYEVRLELPELGGDDPRLPGALWDGASPAGLTLLISIEQGLGDTIQFARYATLLAAGGARCLMRCPDAPNTTRMCRSSRCRASSAPRQKRSPPPSPTSRLRKRGARLHARRCRAMGPGSKSVSAGPAILSIRTIAIARSRSWNWRRCSPYPRSHGSRSRQAERRSNWPRSRAPIGSCRCREAVP
jgi:Flp pilus assembly protein TadD